MSLYFIGPSCKENLPFVDLKAMGGYWCDCQKCCGKLVSKVTTRWKETFIRIQDICPQLVALGLDAVLKMRPTKQLGYIW